MTHFKKKYFFHVFVFEWQPYQGPCGKVLLVPSNPSNSKALDEDFLFLLMQRVGLQNMGVHSAGLQNMGVHGVGLQNMGVYIQCWPAEHKV